MLFQARVSSLVSLAAAISLIAGCSGGGSQLPATSQSELTPQQVTTQQSFGRAMLHQFSPYPSIDGELFLPNLRSSPTWFSPDAAGTTTYTFVADEIGGAIEIFDQKSHEQIGSIGGFYYPTGLATDGNGSLYVADFGHIRIYAAPYTGTPKVIKLTDKYPIGLHVDKAGNLWVAIVCSGTFRNCTGPGGLIEFKSGSSKPVTLAGAPARSFFVATNSAGDVWIDGQTSSGQSTIGYFKGGTGAYIPSKITFVFPGSVQFDSKDNLLVVDQYGHGSGSILDVYAPGKIKPTNSIRLSFGDDVVEAALSSDMTEIFAPLFGAGTTNILRYPTAPSTAYDSAQIGTLTPSLLGNPDAVAVAPRTLP